MTQISGRVGLKAPGPYRRWRHEHRFGERPGGTAVLDRVRYALPGGPGLERLVHRFLVGRDVARILDHRRRRLEELFVGSSGA